MCLYLFLADLYFFLDSLHKSSNQGLGMAVLVLVLGFLVLHVIQKLLNVLFAAFNNIFFKSSQALLTDVTLQCYGHVAQLFTPHRTAARSSAGVIRAPPVHNMHVTRYRRVNIR